MVRAVLVFWMSAAEQPLPMDMAEEIPPYLEKRFLWELAARLSPSSR